MTDHAAPALPAAVPATDRPDRPGPWTYTRYELARAFRNRRFMAFSLGFPLILFFLIAGPNQHQHIEGISLPTYFMAGMTAWGSMMAVLGGGARISQERSVNWHRQLRITPLRTPTYIATKFLTAYAMAVLSMLVVYAAGTLLGVRLEAARWFEMSGYVLVGLIPFAVIGLVLGHLLTVDAMGPALGGVTSLFAVLGGAWGPVATQGWLRDLVELIPSYWIVQAGHTAVGGDPWPAKAWIVLAVWTVVATRVAVWAYRRDTNRI